MKVTNNQPSHLTSVGSGKIDKATLNSSAKKTSVSNASDLGGSATVDLSPKAQDIKKIKEVALNSSPDVDEAKVARFRELIDKGNYKVDAAAVADRMVDEFVANSGADE